MIEIDLARADERERARWRRALDEKPIFSEREYALDGSLLVVALVATTLACFVSVGTTTPGVSVLRALTAAAAAALAVSLAHSRQTRRLEFPPGRYLYRWGYVEIAGNLLLIVPGVEITHRVERGVLSATGAGPIAVHLSASDWSTVFRYRGSELDVPTEALADLTHRRIEPVTEHYRQAPMRAPAGARGRPRWSWRGKAFVAAALAAALGGGAPFVVELVQTTMRAERERVARRALVSTALHEPYRSILLPYADERSRSLRVLDDHCGPTEQSIEPVNAYTRLHGDGQPMDVMRSVYAPVAPFDVPLWTVDPSAPLRLDVACTWTPVGMNPYPPARALLDVRARLTLSRDGQPLVERQFDVGAAVAEMVHGCRFSDDFGPFERVVRVSLALVRAAIRNEVFTPSHAPERAWDLNSSAGDVNRCIDAHRGDSSAAVQVHDP